MSETLKRLLLRWLAPPDATFYGADVMENTMVRLEGHLRATGLLLLSPVTDRECLAYDYRATKLRTGTRRHVQTVLYSAVVFAPGLILILKDGHVQLTFPSSDPDFGSAGHRALVERNWAGFRARERLILEDQCVRIVGRARRVPTTDELTVAVREVYTIGTAWGTS